MEILALVIPGIIIALLLSAWAHFADDRPPLAVALYLVFGLSAIALIGFGALNVLFADQLVEMTEDDAFVARTGIFLIVGGLVTGLPLIPQVRSILSRIMPIKARSIPDMVGLIVMLNVVVIMVWTIDLTFENGDQEFAAARGAELALQALLLVAIAYFAVGGAINRDLKSVQERLGLYRPTARQVGMSVLLIIPLFIVSAIGGLLTEIFQPGFTEQIDEIMGEVTGDLINFEGALLIGITAGIGEEILFRGAIQPKYGLIFASLIFTLIHVQYGFSFVLVGVFLTAMILGIQRKRMNTTCCIITHATYNFAVVMLSTLA